MIMEPIKAPVLESGSSKVLAAVAVEKEKIDPLQVDVLFEGILNSRSCPASMRDRLRNVDQKIKIDFIKKERENLRCAEASAEEYPWSYPWKDGKTATFTVPEDFITLLRKVEKPAEMEMDKLHKLRLLLRNQPVAWVEKFITDGGMTELIGLLHKVLEIDWRTMDEDAQLHEVLLCLKAICTTDLAVWYLRNIHFSIFPPLLAMLFATYNKAPADFKTRGIIMSLLFSFLGTGTEPGMSRRAIKILEFLRDPPPAEEDRTHDFIAAMLPSRPYKLWCREISNVVRDVCWIYLHHMNVIPVRQDADSAIEGNDETFRAKHFPRTRAPIPTAAWVGSVEWDATNYLATHLDLMNGIIAVIPTAEERNDIREELRVSGFERIMGDRLRICNPKFYGVIHDGLQTWVSAAVDDDWDILDVRLGSLPPNWKSQCNSPQKKEQDQPPKLDVPMLTECLREVEESGYSFDDDPDIF